MIVNTINVYEVYIPHFFYAIPGFSWQFVFFRVFKYKRKFQDFQEFQTNGRPLSILTAFQVNFD